MLFTKTKRLWKHAGKLSSVFYAISARKKLCSCGIVCGIMHKVNEPLNVTMKKIDVLFLLLL